MSNQEKNQEPVRSILEFQNLINNEAINNNINVVFDEDDLKQELYLKLMEMSLEVPRKDAFAFAKRVIQNRRKDIQRHYIIRPDTSRYALNPFHTKNEGEGSTQEENIVQENSTNLSGTVMAAAEQSAFDVYSYKQLKSLIVHWLSYQDEKTNLYISDCCNLDTADDAHAPRMLRLNIPMSKKIKIIHSLANYLAKNGYKFDILKLAPHWTEMKSVKEIGE